MAFSSYIRLCGLAALATVLPTVVASNVAVRGPHFQRQRTRTTGCHSFPGDADWPSEQQWQNLNQSVEGRLIAGRPLASVCYGSEADGAACADVRDEWLNVTTYDPDPVAIMSIKFLNNSCSPFIQTATGTEPDVSACSQGNLPSYAINVSSAADIVTGIKFARDRNIRLVVKNTGHDFQGRSSGSGSLSLWTHSLNSISLLRNYTSKAYTGPAIRLGAGVQAYEAYDFAAANNLRVIGGLAPTVGVAGGYVTGGGHGPLMGRYGLAADNSLEFEVVTPDGGYMVTSPSENADLFWALNGGGGSAYAVILSQTVRAHSEGPVYAMNITFTRTSDAAYWAAIDAWHVALPSLNRVPGFACSFSVGKDDFVTQMKALDDTSEKLLETVAPFLARLDQLNVTYAAPLTFDPTFHAWWSRPERALPYGDYPTNSLAGGRFIPTSLVQANHTRADLIAAIRSMVNSTTAMTRIGGNMGDLSVSHTGLRNAVHPAWRTAVYSLLISSYPDPAASVEELRRADDEMVAGQGVLRDMTPGGGAYLNEATYEPEYWKDDFYGPNYDELLEVKQRHDSGFLLYGPAVVGSDHWTVASDGRLCRA